MLQIQDSLLKASAKELLRTDLLHMTSKEQDLTEFVRKFLRPCGLGTGGGWNDEPVKKCNAVDFRKEQAC
jgi:hypothetical protein